MGEQPNFVYTRWVKEILHVWQWDKMYVIDIKKWNCDWSIKGPVYVWEVIPPSRLWAERWDSIILYDPL